MTCQAQLRLSGNATYRHARYVRPQTAAARVKALRQHAGSHDRLAAALRDLGAQGVARQTIIRWENAGTPEGNYPANGNAAALVAYATANGFQFTLDELTRPRLENGQVEAVAQRLERLVAAGEELADRLERLLDGIAGAQGGPRGDLHARTTP